MVVVKVVVVVEVDGIDIGIEDTEDVDRNMDHHILKDKTMEWV